MEYKHSSSIESYLQVIEVGGPTDLIERLNLNSAYKLNNSNSSDIFISEENKLIKIQTPERAFNFKPSECDFYLSHIINTGSPNNQRLGLNYKLAKSKFNSFEIIDYLNIFSENSKDSIEFSKYLLQLKGAKNFETIHLFINEKGKSLSSHREISKNHYSSQNISTIDFNSLIFSVKKSRNRSYGQTKLNGDIHNIIGTFLAQEFSFSNFNIVFIFSRNDFLEQTQEEIDFFKYLITFLPPYLEIILEREIELKKLKNLKSIFDNIPLKYQLSDSPLDSTKSNALPSGVYYKTVSKELDSIDHADIYHNERVALLGELLNTLRHELSNPLFGLQLSSEILVDELQGDNKVLVGEIINSINRSQEIINNFTKLYSHSEEKLEVNLLQLLNEVCTLTKSESRTIKKDLIVPSNLMITTNPVWLAQVFFNLIVNSSQAMKKMNNATIRIESKISSGYLSIYFSDNGPGISNELSENIFTPFYTTKDHGTGLGLSITKMLTEKLNGTIELTKLETPGANFKLRFKI